MTTTTTNLDQAIQEYYNRRDRKSHPKGKFDGTKRWYPDATEERPCCSHIRSPSRRFPFSYMLHCRTIEHVANLYDVDPKVLGKAVRKVSPPTRLGGTFYKAVAVVTQEDGDHYYSIFDGTSTEYVFGKKLTEAVRREHNGGYYVYDSIIHAMEAEVPDNSVLYSAPRAILEVEVSGQYTRYECKCRDCRDARFYKEVITALHPTKYAFSSIVPIRVVAGVGDNR